MAIVYRAIKGAKLNSTEIDGNFHDLDDRVTDLTNNPPEALSIDHFRVEGTLLTVVMSDGSEQGPFILPQAQWRWTGVWAPDITYLPGDLFTESGDVYYVRVMHVSESPFDPGLMTDDGLAYVLVISKSTQPYDVGFYFHDLINSGVEVLGLHVALRQETFLEDFAGSLAYLRIATTTSTIVLPIYLNGTTVVGTITFEPADQLTDEGGQFGTFNSIDPGSVIAAATDRLSITQPYEDDATAAGLAVTLHALVEPD